MRDQSGMRSETVGAGGCVDVPAWLWDTPEARSCPPSEERAGGRPRTEGAPLSLAHITSTSEKEPKPTEVKDKAYWYVGASLGCVPGIPSQDPRMNNPSKRRVVPRGEVLEFSPASRRRCERTLHTVTFASLAYTMALTLPDDFEAIPPPQVKRLFLRLLDRLMASRCPILQKVGGFWKQEFQKRGALHFHLLLYGIKSWDARFVQNWISGQWNGLIGDAYPKEEREKHLWWHCRDGTEKRRGVKLATYNKDEDNFQEVADFAGYFAKYYGKDEEAGILSEPVPGKWWGRFNKANIPWAERKEIALPLRVRIHVQRAARKARLKRAAAAKHGVAMAKIKKAHGLPSLTATQLEYGRHYRKGTPLGELYRHLAKGQGVPIGKPRFPSCFRYSSVILTGKHIPALLERLLRYGGDRALLDREARPF